jgi:glutathione reductase (NADPH)
VLAAGSRPHSRIQQWSLQVRAASSGNGAGNGAPEQYDFDLFTIGAGSGGTRASRMAAQNHGARVAVCELPFGYISSDSVGGAGGTCVLRGCVPKKLVVYASSFTQEFAESRGFGWNTPENIELDWKKFQDKKNSELQRLNGVYDKLLAKAGVKYIEGRGKLVDAHTVDVDGKRYTAKNILIAVGGRAFKAPIEGAEHSITSDDILVLPKIPKKLVVIGGGYIGLEFASMFRALGSEVEVFIRGPGLLRGFDKETVEFATSEYKRRGINIHQFTSPSKIEKNEDGSVTVHADKQRADDPDVKDAFQTRADYCLMATGRKPNTHNLGLEEVGVELDDAGGVKVDDFSRSSVPHIYAIGDVTNRLQLTPVALMEGMAFVKNVFGDDADARPVYENVASAVFTAPQLATCGLTEEEAVDACGDLKIFTSSFRGMRATISGDEGKGFLKLIVAKDTDKLVGAHFVGSEVAEIMQGISVAMKMGVTKKQLDSTVGIHPSSAEEIVTMRDMTREVSAKDSKASPERQEAGRNS